jgi:predicted transcriptional regulator
MAAKPTTIKLPRELKARIARLAKKTGRTSHGFMVEALERQTAREERMEAFIKEALDADRQIEAGGDVYAAEDVHAWMERLARGERAARPKPWRG